jgi:hypothetical protein
MTLPIFTFLPAVIDLQFSHAKFVIIFFTPEIRHFRLFRPHLWPCPTLPLSSHVSFTVYFVSHNSFGGASSIRSLGTLLTFVSVFFLFFLFQWKNSQFSPYIFIIILVFLLQLFAHLEYFISAACTVAQFIIFIVQNSPPYNAVISKFNKISPLLISTFREFLLQRTYFGSHFQWLNSFIQLTTLTDRPGLNCHCSRNYYLRGSLSGCHTLLRHRGISVPLDVIWDLWWTIRIWGRFVSYVSSTFPC